MNCALRRSQSLSNISIAKADLISSQESCSSFMEITVIVRCCKRSSEKRKNYSASRGVSCCSHQRNTTVTSCDCSLGRNIVPDSFRIEKSRSVINPPDKQKMFSHSYHMCRKSNFNANLSKSASTKTLVDTGHKPLIYPPSPFTFRALSLPCLIDSTNFYENSYLQTHSCLGKILYISDEWDGTQSHSVTNKTFQQQQQTNDVGSLRTWENHIASSVIGSETDDLESPRDVRSPAIGYAESAMVGDVSLEDADPDQLIGGVSELSNNNINNNNTFANLQAHTPVRHSVTSNPLHITNSETHPIWQRRQATACNNNADDFVSGVSDPTNIWLPLSPKEMDHVSANCPCQKPKKKEGANLEPSSLDNLALSSGRVETSSEIPGFFTGRSLSLIDNIESHVTSISQSTQSQTQRIIELLAAQRRINRQYSYPGQPLRTARSSSRTRSHTSNNLGVLLLAREKTQALLNQQAITMATSNISNQIREHVRNGDSTAEGASIIDPVISRPPAPDVRTVNSHDAYSCFFDSQIQFRQSKRQNLHQRLGLDTNPTLAPNGNHMTSNTMQSKSADSLWSFSASKKFTAAQNCNDFPDKQRCFSCDSLTCGGHTDKVRSRVLTMSNEGQESAPPNIQPSDDIVHRPKSESDVVVIDNCHDNNLRFNQIDCPTIAEMHNDDSKSTPTERKLSGPPTTSSSRVRGRAPGFKNDALEVTLPTPELHSDQSVKTPNDYMEHCDIKGLSIHLGKICDEIELIEEADNESTTTSIQGSPSLTVDSSLESTNSVFSFESGSNTDCKEIFDLTECAHKDESGETLHEDSSNIEVISINDSVNIDGVCSERTTSTPIPGNSADCNGPPCDGTNTVEQYINDVQTLYNPVDVSDGSLSVIHVYENADMFSNNLEQKLDSVVGSKTGSICSEKSLDSGIGNMSLLSNDGRWKWLNRPPTPRPEVLRQQKLNFHRKANRIYTNGSLFDQDSDSYSSSSESPAIIRNNKALINKRTLGAAKAKPKSHQHWKAVSLKNSPSSNIERRNYVTSTRYRSCSMGNSPKRYDMSLVNNPKHVLVAKYSVTDVARHRPGVRHVVHGEVASTDNIPKSSTNSHRRKSRSSIFDAISNRLFRSQSSSSSESLSSTGVKDRELWLFGPQVVNWDFNSETLNGELTKTPESTLKVYDRETVV